LTVSGNANGGQAGARSNVRELIGPGNPEIGASGFDSRDGVPEIVILQQRRAFQFLQLLVLEYFKPLEIR
jgi:hypothetical protein